MNQILKRQTTGATSGAGTPQITFMLWNINIGLKYDKNIIWRGAWWRYCKTSANGWNIKFSDKMRTKTTLSEQFQNPIAKYVEKGNIDTTDTQIHDCSLSTITSINSGDSKLVLWSQTFQKLGLFCTAFMLKCNDCMVILNRMTARRLPHGPLFGFLFTAPFLPAWYVLIL